MLEALRKNSKNAIIYVLFGVIIAVFVINFGPGSKGCDSTSGQAYAAKVAGATVSENEYRYSYIAQGFTQYPPQFAREQHLKERVMSKLIERELLAQEAERMGFDVSEDEVGRMIEDGRIYVLGIPRKTEDFKRDGTFEYERLKAFCRNRLNVEVQTFIEVQRREMLADKVRQVMLGAVKVPADDVKTDYDARGLQVNLEFVRLQARPDEVTVTAADIEGWKKGHEAEIKKSYDDRPYLYKKIDKNAHLRRVMVTVAKDAPEAEVAKAKAKIDDAAKRVKAGQSFAEVAKALTDDTRGQKRGGDMGWHKKGFTGLGAAIDEKVFAAKDGEVIGPERDDRGFELVKVEGFREGDLTLEQVSSEIAEEQVRVDLAKQKARAEAETAAAAVKKGETLAKLFPKPAEDEDPMKRIGAPTAVQETGAFNHRGELIPQMGVSAEMMKKAFEAKQGDVLGPIDVGSAVVVAVVKERKEPDHDFFEKHKQDESRKAEREKWAEAVEDWARQRCTEVKTEGRIKVNEEVLQYEGLPAKAGETKYEPCSKL